MERLKSRVHDDNCFEFEQKIRSSKESAVAALQGFRPSEEDPLLAGHHPLAGGAGDMLYCVIVGVTLSTIL